MKYDYIVIGAGLAGLTTAAIIAKQGLRVALIEKSHKTAPILRGFRRKGILFDTGLHYSGGLGENDILDVFFRYLGIRGSLVTEALDEQGFDIIHHTDREFTFRLPSGVDPIRNALKTMFPEENEAIDWYLAAVDAIYSSLPYINLDAPLIPLKWSADGQGRTLKEVLDGLTENRLLKRLLSTHCLLHGVLPEEVSFFAHACVVAPYYRSVHRIKGGGERLAEVFDACLLDLGVETYTGRAAQALCFTSDGTLRGIRLADGEEVSGTTCVSTIHPREMLKLVPDSMFRPVYRRRLEAFEESSSAYILYGIGGTVAEQIVGRNHFLLATGDLAGLDSTVPLESRPLYLTAAGEDGERGKAFMALCPASISELGEWMGSMTGRRPSGYKTHKENVTETMLGRVASVCPEFSGDLAYVGCATPLTLRDYGNTPFGSLYGIKHRVGHYDPLPATRLKNLFLAGQAVAAPGLLGAMISAFLASGNILGHEHLREQLRKNAE